MNRIVFKSFAIIFLAIVLVTPVFPWDEVGHKLTAYIAWERMNPNVRDKVIKTLLDAPEDSDLNVHYDRFNSRSDSVKRRELFMYASIWSDVIRNRAFETRHKNYNQGDWHYADIFWKQENGKAMILTDFPEESGKAIPKLFDFEKILKDPSYKTEEKAIALAWFLHVGGDIHNPVHNAARITENSPKGDQGGNRFVLRKRAENQRGLNLHSYWDGIIGRVKTRKNDACDTPYLAPIARKMMKKYPYSKMQGRLKLGDYKAWNMEGFNFLNSTVYNGIQRNQLPSKKYRKRAFNVASQQITLAGYRLGDTLNKVFTETSTAFTKPEKPDLSPAEAIAIWNRVNTVINKSVTFKFIQIEVAASTVTLRGIVGSDKLRSDAIKAVQNIKGVQKVIDRIEIDPSILKTKN